MYNHYFRMAVKGQILKSAWKLPYYNSTIMTWVENFMLKMSSLIVFAPFFNFTLTESQRRYELL